MNLQAPPRRQRCSPGCGSKSHTVRTVGYTAEIRSIISRHGDDYTSTSVSDAHSAIDQFSCCLQDVQKWMSATTSRLCLNASKTQVLWLGFQHVVNRLTVHDVQVLSAAVHVVNSARDLGVVIDSRLTMADHAASVCRSAYYQPRPIRPALQQSLIRADAIVQTFVASRLDYCNSALYGITYNLLQIQRLQSVQNVTARLITKTSRQAHITSVLPRLHWLPAGTLTLMFTTLHGLAPFYLSDSCQLVPTVRCQLQSQLHVLQVTRT